MRSAQERRIPTIVARQTRTLADMVALPDESPICEIFGGDLVVKNGPDANHAFLIIDLIGFLIDVQDAGYGYVFSDPRAVALDYPERGEAAQDVTQADTYPRQGAEAVSLC